MKKIFLTFAAVLVGLSIFTAEAKRPAHAGGPKQATIAVTQGAGTATFTVTQENYGNPYLLWVANKCFENGNQVTAEYQPVVWNGDVGTAGPFDTDGSPDFAIDSCTAYVWEFPASETPERVKGNDVAVTYAVAP